MVDAELDALTVKIPPLWLIVGTPQYSCTRILFKRLPGVFYPGSSSAVPSSGPLVRRLSGYRARRRPCHFANDACLGWDQ